MGSSLARGRVGAALTDSASALAAFAAALAGMLWRRGGRIARLARDQLDLRSLAQLVGAVDHHLRPRRDAALHCRDLALHRPELERLHADALVIAHGVDERPGGAALDGSAGHERRVGTR